MGAGVPGGFNLIGIFAPLQFILCICLKGIREMEHVEECLREDYEKKKVHNFMTFLFVFFFQFPQILKVYGKFICRKNNIFTCALILSSYTSPPNEGKNNLKVGRTIIIS